jgi:hypothetical protein
VHTITARTRADNESSAALEEGGLGRTLTFYPRPSRDLVSKIGRHT